MTILVLDANIPVYLRAIENNAIPGLHLPSGLGTLSASGFPIVMTDVVRGELADRGPSRSRQEFKQWEAANPSSIRVVPTAAGAALDNGLIPRKNAGEESIVEILNPANRQFGFIQADYLLATNDSKFDWSKHGIPDSRIMGLVPLINVLYRQGVVGEAEYKSTRAVLQKVFGTLPGVDSRPGKTPELMNDAELKTYRFHTPVTMPQGADVTVTSRMGPPIKPGKP